MQENLSLYHIFYTVGRTGNISQAARELYISQPAISRAIQKLEENLDTTLFKRNSRGVTLTPDGALLYEKVQAAFSLLLENWMRGFCWRFPWDLLFRPEKLGSSVGKKRRNSLCCPSFFHLQNPTHCAENSLPGKPDRL